MPKYWDYVGFSFNGVHSSDLGILRVSDGSRYEENSIPEFRSETAEVVGGHGTYFWGTNYTKRTFTLNLAYDSITEEQVRAIRQTYHAQALGELIFDEWPYKAYNATIESPPNFKFVPFKRDEYVKAFETAPSRLDFSQNYYKLENGEYKYQLVAYVDDWNSLYLFKSQWYKGEGTITFVCYEPFAHSTVNWREELFHFKEDLNPDDSKMSSYYKRFWEEDRGGPYYYKCRRNERVQEGEGYYIRQGIQGSGDPPEKYRRYGNYYEWINTIPLGYIQQNSRGEPWCVCQEKHVDNDYSKPIEAWRTILYNPGDVATDLKVRFLVDDLLTSGNWLDNSEIWGTFAILELDRDGNTAGAVYNGCTLTLNKFTPNAADKYIYFDTKSHTLYGAKSNGEPTGRLYNKYISAGDFFQLPVYPNFHIDDLGRDPHLCFYSKMKYQRIKYNFLYY